MAFPTIPTVAAGRILFTLNTTGGATKTFPNLSSLTKASGDLLLAIAVEYDGNSTNAEFSSWGGGFTEARDAAGTATMAIGVAYKWSTGSETGTFTVTTADTSTNDSVMILMAIPGAHASQAPHTSGMVTGTAPDVGANDPGWGVQDILWIAVGASGEDNTTGSYTGIGTAPTNYGNQADSGITADAAGGAEASVAFRQLAAAAEDPGPWSMDTSNARGAAMLLAIRPAALANADAEVAWAETEVPNARADAEVSWAEFEVPTAQAQAQVSWAEFEVPNAGADAEVAWAELEVPELAVNADAEVAWAEFEVPLAADAEIAWAEFEVPFGQSDGEVSFAEFEVPTAQADAEISWAEFEVPTAGADAEISWAEFEVPTAGSQAEVSWADFQVPDAPGPPGGEWLQDKHIIHHVP